MAKKQRISYRANAEDHCRGHFWESSFLSVPLLERGAVVACMVYVDAKPFRVGLGERREQAEWTSLWARTHSEHPSTHRSANPGDPWHDPLLTQAALARHLTPLAQIPPLDPYTGELPSCTLDLLAYGDLVNHACGLERQETTQAHIRGWGIDPDIWQTVMADPGRFQSAAVGGGEARKAYAEACGRKWIADKTPIWLGEG